MSEKVVREISFAKKEPKWMLDKRLEALRVFKAKPMPKWGADLSGLDFSSFTYFKQPEGEAKRSWADVPKKARETFENLKIPQAERRWLSGVGAQWDSGVVYQHLKDKMEKLGVVFCDMDEAVKKYPKQVKKYFMSQCIKAEDNKFSALHGAVWSGGSFVYVPRGVKVSEPLQGFFWLNLMRGGQFEHTLIIVEEGGSLEFIEGCSAPTYQKESLHAGVVEIFVGKKARVKYVTVQNWSRDVYNLATKRAEVQENGLMEWVSGSMGSKKTMVYPSSILIGNKAKANHLSLSLAGKGQELDTGGKVIHIGKETSSNLVAKSISKDGGTTSFRGLVKMVKGAKGAKSSMSCESLILDKKSQAKTYPQMEILEDEVVATHEAKTGKIAEEELFYLQSRGLSQAEAMSLIVNGFMEPVIKQLPLEYAVEMNRLIELNMEGKVG